MIFKVGDIVQLKSGGPDMTVTRSGTSGGEPMVWCAWFEGTKDAYGLFPPAALEGSSRPTKRPKLLSDPPEALDGLPEAKGLPTGGGELLSTGAPATSGVVEASQDPHPAQPDSAPAPEASDKSTEAQIASIQSLIAGLLKRS